MFLDHVTIEVGAGDGGEGAVAFRRESMVPHGGPSGGDGGRGGDVVVEADDQLATLLDFRYRSVYRAGRGEHGSGSNRSGADGEDLVLRVPPGTVIRNADEDSPVGEVLAHGDRLVVARGGRGGRGNAYFATATNQAPRRAQPGEPGEARRLDLELKLIADVGLVGEPNAGKSTFLAAVSAARPKVADYPFTTLTPNLGVIQRSDGRTMVIADIPGIIEGAHEGKGLGHQFLRHIERTRVLALMIPSDAIDPAETYRALLDELRTYSPALASKPHCVALTKSDLLPPDWPVEAFETEGAWDIYLVSSVARRGLEEMLEGLWSRVERARSEDDAEARGPQATDPDPGDVPEEDWFDDDDEH